MLKFLKRVISLHKDETHYGTHNYHYVFSYITLFVDLGVLAFIVNLPYWVTRETQTARMARIEEMLQFLNEKLNSVRAAEKAATKKRTRKEPAAPKKASKKAAPKKKK